MTVSELFFFILARLLSFLFGRTLFPYIGWWGTPPASIFGFGFVYLLIVLLHKVPIWSKKRASTKAPTYNQLQQRTINDRQPSEPNLSRLSGPIREFAQHVLQAFPEWASMFECYGIDDCSFCVVSPLHPEHRLCVETRGSNSVEVRYDDARPPGPAEKLFVDLDQQPKEVAAAVVGFVRDLFADRVVVVRKRVRSTNPLAAA